MIISVTQAVLDVERLLPKFDVTTTVTTDNLGRSRLWFIIEVKQGEVNSRGQDLPVGSYATREDIALHSGGVEKSDVTEVVEQLKINIRNYDRSNGWTNLL